MCTVWYPYSIVSMHRQAYLDTAQRFCVSLSVSEHVHCTHYTYIGKLNTPEFIPNVNCVVFGSMVQADKRKASPLPVNTQSVPVVVPVSTRFAGKSWG